MKVHPTSFGAAREERTSSHDALAIKSSGETVLAVLAHGARRSALGQEAARRAVGSFVANYQTRPRNWTPQKALVEFTRLVNRTLHEDSLARFGGPELVTALSVALVEGDRLYGLNVGDSRVYLARNGCLARLSPGDTALTAGSHGEPVVGLGLEPEVKPYLFETELQDGDVALLCSPRVSDLLDEQARAAQLNDRGAVRSLVSLACRQAEAQPPDDLSAIVLDIEETGRVRPVERRANTIPATLSKGQVVDGFTLLKPFLRSERVWLAMRDGRRFTLKFAPFEAHANEELLQLFIKEIRNATRLGESGFFPRAFVPEPASTWFYAMDFIEAPSLASVLRARNLTVDESVALGKLLLTAAQYLLRFDLVHGDIKPDNVLVVRNYDELRFRLVDFGSVTEVFSVTSRAGTASYLAPERFRRAPIAERTELFAVGVTLYQALTGTLPFGEIERFQTPSFHPARRPSQLNPNIPPWLDSVLLRALSLEPEHRYQNYSEMLFDLEHPDKVVPYHSPDTPLLERDPLRFYRTGFFLLLALCFGLVLLLISYHANRPVHP